MGGTRALGGCALVAALFCVPVTARADGFDVSGYADFRLIAPPSQTSWLHFGLSKFRYGNSAGNVRFAEAVGQGAFAMTEDITAIAVVRAEPEQPDGIDGLEAYLSWHPNSSPTLWGSDIGWKVKAGAFFPSISLENDDLGWASPYTLTPSAINSWIGEEVRTIGSEATLRWHAPNMGTLSLIGAITSCNDPAGSLMAYRGWAMEDRPTGLFERLPIPNATERLFQGAAGTRMGEFDEIDGRPGWYAGITWQMAELGKLSVLRYDNEGDPAAKTAHDTAWDTRFWSYGLRTNIAALVLIAQGLQGQTVLVSRPGFVNETKYQSAFLLASYDWDDWRISSREDLFQTRHVAATPSPLSEDGRAFTASLSWSGFDWLRVTGEVVAMDSRRGEYILDGAPTPTLSQTLTQLSTRFFF